MTTFNFSEFLTKGLPNHKKTVCPHFLEWFIGFYEGDGSLYQWQYGGKLRTSISIDQKDPTVLYKMRTILGFGRVRNYTKESGEIYWRYAVESQAHVYRLLILLNGNLILNKRQEQFG
jgi:hypothetical protein